MEVIKIGTNIATVKISELPQTTDTAGRSTLATNADNESEALVLTQIVEAIDAATNAQQAATEAKEAAKNANTLAGVARTAANNAEAAAEDAQTTRDSAETAANTAQQAAADAEKTAADISQDLTGKADLDADKKYLLPTQLDPTTGYQTGMITGKGVFKTDNSNVIFKDKPHTTMLAFVIPKNLSFIQVMYNEGAGGTNAYGFYVYVSTSKTVAAVMRGTTLATKTLSSGAICFVAMSYTPDGQCLVRINETAKTLESVEYKYEDRAAVINIGGQETGTNSRSEVALLFCRTFDFAMTAEQLTEAWNNGHPELWRIPDEFRAHEIVWPIDNVTESQNAFLGNSPSQITLTNNVPQENGFSGAFQRFAGASKAPGVYCNLWIYSYNRAPIRLTIEYRSTSDLYSDFTLTKLLLPANTGDAKTVTLDVIAGAYGGTIYAKTTDDTFEIRTIKAEEIGCVLDLNAHGLLPTVWRDTSGHGNDVPYVSFSENPAECELSYENHGFKDIIIGTAAPTITPDFIGQKFIDTTNKVTYTAYGTTAASDWGLN